MSTTVMVVDDSMMIRQQVARTLRDAGYVIVEASDGQDALDKLTAHPEVALVVCDVNMPRMSGIEFLERSLALPNPPPFVMLTTEGQVPIIQRAKALGAKGWMIKPFKADILLAAARKLAPQA